MYKAIAYMAKKCFVLLLVSCFRRSKQRRLSMADGLRQLVWLFRTLQSENLSNCWLVVVDHFYIALFSTLEQTHCAHM